MNYETVRKDTPAPSTFPGAEAILRKGPKAGCPPELTSRSGRGGEEMEPFRHHIYVCTQQKPEGAPSCTANGSPRTLEALRRADA